ncbi:hypothetical protein A5674_25330 [Mycobacterium malmoense]|nr:secretion protein EspB [Mycobacterium malmoense]OCB22703.1 hypothetical protein A5674_25330 [Mycobacterium malmoense]
MTQTLNVEYDELMQRAAELEEPLPPPPAGDPQPTSALPIAIGAATQLAMSATTIREYLGYCEREYKRLAKSLRNAAKAYEEVDEEAAQSINNTLSGPGATGVAAGNGQMMINCDPDEDWGMDLPKPSPPPPPPPFEYPYYEVRQAAYDIEAPDQGVAFLEFSRQWDAYQLTLQEQTIKRFRPFMNWESDSQVLVEQNFEQHRSYIFAMVQYCLQISKQAKAVYDAHKKARWEHPAPYDIESCDSWYKKYMTEGDPYGYMPMIMTWYRDLQKKSEEVLGAYVREANLPLAPVTPKNPPVATRIAPPPDPNQPGEDDGIFPGFPTDGLPGDDGGVPAAPMMPTLPTGGMPKAPDQAAMTAAMKDAMKGGAGAPKGAGMKPASLGGGGGAGAPSMPLQPAVDSEAVSRPAGAAPGAAAPGRAMPGGGGATAGGMGGGMAPMGGAGQNQNQGKGKRVQSEDESLYTEERAWTEGVIGNRPRKTAADK